MKIVQINGFRGLITIAFIGICLFAGFVVFPGLISMHLWNKYLVTLASFPVIDLFQGVLLWGIIAVSYFILTKGSASVSFKHVNDFNNSDIDNIIKRAKIQSQIRKINMEIQKTDKFEKNKDLSEINTIMTSEQTSEKDENISNVK